MSQVDKRILVCIVCENYWNRMALCAESLARASSNAKCNATIVAATTDDDAPEIAGVIIEREQKTYKNRKPYLLYEAFKGGLTAIGGMPEWIMFADADIVYPPDIFTAIDACENESTFISSTRVHASRQQVEDMLGKPLPDESALVEIANGSGTDRPSEFMGWCQIFSADLFRATPFSQFMNHEGYDKFDYKVMSVLKQEAKKVMCMAFSRHPIHLSHGNWGKNWRGCSEPH